MHIKKKLMANGFIRNELQDKYKIAKSRNVPLDSIPWKVNRKNKTYCDV